MATPVLPYPNMDFTPLDILTAAEMDQMVANDQYLRDFCAGLADGTNLSDGVIQARKLDYATLPDKMTKIATIDFPQDVLQLTLPYTATEDCFIRLSDSGTISQNNKQIRNTDNTGYTWHFVAKGDVIRQMNGSNTCYLFPVRYV